MLVQNGKAGEEARTKLVALSMNMVDLRLVVASSKSQIPQKWLLRIQIHVLHAIPIPTVDEESSLSTSSAEGVGDVGRRVVFCIRTGQEQWKGRNRKFMDYISLELNSMVDCVFQG